MEDCVYRLHTLINESMLSIGLYVEVLMLAEDEKYMDLRW